MGELTIEQLTQRFGELQFLEQHHQSLAKHYSRELFNTELAIQQAQQTTETSSEE